MFPIETRIELRGRPHSRRLASPLRSAGAASISPEMASSLAAAAKIPKHMPSAEWRKGVPELPTTSPELQRAALAGIMQQLHAEDPGLTRAELTKQAIQAFPQRHNKAEAVLVNMEYCQQNDEDYDPFARVGKPPGPAHTADASPAAVTRAQTAFRKEGASRAAVAKHSELAEKEGAPRSEPRTISCS